MDFRAVSSQNFWYFWNMRDPKLLFRQFHRHFWWASIPIFDCINQTTTAAWNFWYYSMIKNSIFININREKMWEISHISAPGPTSYQIFKRSAAMNFLRVAHFYYSYYMQYYFHLLSLSYSLPPSFSEFLAATFFFHLVQFIHRIQW